MVQKPLQAVYPDNCKSSLLNCDFEETELYPIGISTVKIKSVILARQEETRNID